VDAVTVAAPTKCHYDIVSTCLNAGKHVLVEKPITTNYEQAVHLFEIAEKKSLVLHIGHVERFNGAVQELKNIVNKPRLIEARRVGQFNPNFKNDSIVLDLMIHDIDIALNIANKPVEAVQAIGAPVYTELVDYASVNIYFGGSMMAHILSSRINQNKERFLNVTQDDALIVLDYTSQDITITRQGKSQHIFGDRELTYKNEFTQERIAVHKDNPLKLEIKHFVDGIVMRTPRIYSIEHDLRSLRVALDVDELLLKGAYGCKEFK
jgi:predicted dehydrogenase